MNKTNALLSIGLGLSLIAVFVCIGYIAGGMHAEPVKVDQSQPVGAAGDLYSTQKVDQIGIDTSTTTIASLYNEESKDRIIVKSYCFIKDADDTTGAPITLQAATSTEATSLNDNTNYLFNQLIVTSTPMLVSSTTPASTDDQKIIWKALSYFNFRLSALATTTASGFCGAEYHNE